MFRKFKVALVGQTWVRLPSFQSPFEFAQCDVVPSEAEEHNLRKRHVNENN